MKIDLHIHTTGSDGSLTPREVVDLAAKRGLEIIAITDHNGVSGISEAALSSIKKGITVISGIEISSFIDGHEVEIHILGLGINPNSPQLKKVMSKISKRSEDLLKKRLIIANNYFGSNISLKSLRRRTLGVPSTRHLGAALMEKKYVQSIDEGKSIFLKEGPGSIKHNNKGVPAKEAIKAIHSAGGFALLAHTFQYKTLNEFVTFKEQEKLIRTLINLGLDGLEIYTPDATKKEIKFGEKIAKQYHLLLSGGSDFHDEKAIRQNKLGFLNISKNKLTILEALENKL